MSAKQPAVTPVSLGVVNAFILRGSRSVIVDTGYPGSANVLINRLSQIGIKLDEISLILITHAHTDHFGSAAELKQQTGAPVAIHQLDAEFLRSGNNPPPRPTGTFSRLLMSLPAFTRTAKVPSLEPDILIEGKMSLHKFGIDGEILPTPGHTPGSISVLLPGGEAIVGDLIMGDLIRRKQPGYPLVADNVVQLRESIKLIMQQSPRVIFIGHGGPLEPERVYRKFLATTS